jgi:A/G-specific adenine glycosylase
VLPNLTDRQRAVLLDWAGENHRDLPWRATRDPWAVLVSELMLQQTQVVRVVPKYHAFLRRFPTPADCAAASVGDVVTQWAGLGYNRRAVNLHRCAQAVTEHHAGKIPDDLGALVALPGIGPYTARAVLAFAFERHVAVVDTNVARVLARWTGRPLSRQEVQQAADAAVPHGHGWSWNQGMLDLGATVCTKRVPRCSDCPARAWCGWQQAGGEGPDPAEGSAGVPARQSRFEGSDRQGRGRLVDALRRDGVVPRAELARVAGWPSDDARAQRAAESLVADGLAEWRDGALLLPS